MIYKFIKNIFLFIFLLLLLLIVFISNSCYYNTKNPNIVYMPDMYYSKAYEPYSDPISPYKTKNFLNIYLFKNGTTSLHPVPKTISRSINNDFEYFIPKSDLGYKKSLKITNSPLNLNLKSGNNKRGERMYKIYCSICHGDIGDGNGDLVKNEKIFGIPNYKNRNITIGSIYYVIMYGKNTMGSYSSQLTSEDRWRIAEYVMKLKKKLI